MSKGREKGEKIMCREREEKRVLEGGWPRGPRKEESRSEDGAERRKIV